ncbi:adenomatous polyposis coli protein-like isoform X2 [Pseudomyrmex gracilis]|nr:adenomatous polyposis coli protein-like isoform X2 [Pseudomyrmex gracilis]
MQTSSGVPKKEFVERDSKVDLFSDYAETDLDQPTDYSLRYAEDDTDEEEKQNTEYFPGSEQEDTVKTYCTEGTPYETPFNFSTATSMSDLRVEDVKENDLPKKLPKKIVEATVKSGPVSFIKQTETANVCDEQDSLMTKELEEESVKDTAVLNPGQVTPEKEIVYYEEEGACQSFSRANSPSSLNSAITPQKDNADISKVDSPPVNKEELENDEQSVLGLDGNQIELSPENDNSPEIKNNPRVLDKEGKMVTFGGQDYYTEETPLMFSRCSSLGSLSGFEQHSIHDDRSSVVSDFSRRTSGVVSPSELPDSPTQTALPSPRNHKTQNPEFVSKIQEEAVRPSVRHLSFSKPQSVGGNSVFEDEVATFKEESTPIEFSTATSLSSLTIDDEVKLPDIVAETYCRSEKTPDADEKNVEKLETDMLNMAVSSPEAQAKEDEQVSDDEDDDDMLAACINMGIQNRYKQSLKTLSSQKSAQSEPSILVSYPRNSISSRSDPHASPVEATVNTSKTRTSMEIVASDTVHVYCTEDTPADISPVGSQSNLSALSMPSVQEDIETIEQDKSLEIDCHRNDLFDESANLSGDDEKILDECIQSGKARQIPPLPTNSILFAKKPESSSHKFDTCGTPLSSPVERSHRNKNPILCSKSPRDATLRYPDEFSDDSPNHSDDEAMLTECIQSAMPKARLGTSPSIRLPLSQPMENTKPMNMRTTASPYFQPRYVEQRKNVTKKGLPYEDHHVGLSEEEEDIMLAQCIRSGMPKAQSPMSTMSSMTTLAVKRSESYSKSSESFSVPSSSCFASGKQYFSRNVASQVPSSCKSVNINATDMRFARNVVSGNVNCFPGRATSGNAAHTSSSQTSRHCDSVPRERTMNNSPCSARRLPSLRNAESENGNPVDSLCVSVRSRVVKYNAPIFNRTDNYDDYACKHTLKFNAVVPSRHNSAMNPVSEENAMTSIEEWNLRKVTITSAMLRNKYGVKGIKSNEGASGHDDYEQIPDDNYSVCSYNSYICKT